MFIFKEPLRGNSIFECFHTLRKRERIQIPSISKNYGPLYKKITYKAIFFCKLNLLF